MYAKGSSGYPVPALIAVFALSGLATQSTVLAQFIPVCMCQVWNAEEIRVNKGWLVEEREREREVNLTRRWCARAANPLTCVQRVEVRQVFVGVGGVTFTRTTRRAENKYSFEHEAYVRGSTRWNEI
ncbi:unnamed protein product [Ectocarpus sp. 13 AM-2016]